MSGHPVTFPSAASLLGHAHLLSCSQSLLVPEPSGLFEETLQGCALLSGVLVSLSHLFKGISATLVFTCQVGALLPSFNTPEMLTS